MVHKIKIVALLLISTLTFAQSKDGYWDNIRTTNETITLRAGEKKVIKTADFPEGTTEIVYRITILDDNQKLSSSLVSVLKAIPDPTGISQGTAGAVFLLSTISGDDKCKYAIFSQPKDADNYLTTEKTDKACIVQDTPINKEARIINSKSTTCMSSKTQNLYFAFQSDNWVLKEKIILEVVPWIDNKASRGWEVDAKKELLKIAQNLDITKTLSKKEQFYALFIETISKKYKSSEFNQLLPIEKNRAIEVATEESLKQTGEINKYFDAIRDKSLALFKKGKITEAIELITTEIINKNKATSTDYALLGNYYLLTKQYSKAEEKYNKGLQLNPSDINLQLKLAHVYMFTDRLSQAKDIHKKYSNQNLENGKTWLEQVKIDFKEFEKFGLPSENLKKILRVLE
ncbi:tetratricopeptide repeat protein [Flavobacterium sp. SUN052]|uniref:tetratricopeptide repeat protein n=1 Tax=Flavobacterium sp. SUN052 TaxID=3002441 RepID=UPI00237DF219|nr:tetratricopeptide repeat protein [Flavobacterium sp. SUN052]MEC4005635.1 tetratricopeptide repeat protein [Flavobacterium sp. SUN052]